MALVRSGRKPIQDEFTDLPVSTARKYQLRNQRDGLCIKCAEPRVEASNLFCLKHWQPLYLDQLRRKEERERIKLEKYWKSKEPVDYFAEMRRQRLTLKPKSSIKKIRYSP